jgi:hypothetical protein
MILRSEIRILAGRLRLALLSTLAFLTLVSCAVSPETQAKMDEYERTIPSCTSDVDCNAKWALARAWTEQNSDFNIRGESDTRIQATSNIISQTGIGVVVNKIATSANSYQIVADLECFSAYSCPELWDLRVDFNRTVNGASE